MRTTFLGVVHLGPCPSAARGRPDFEPVLAAALKDAEALASGGVDGILVENFGDAPFHKGSVEDPVPPDVPAALAVVARAVRVATGLPVGVNCLRNDGVGALGAAAVAGARWVRVNVLTGAMVTDQGLIGGEAARVAGYRKQLGVDVVLLADLLVKHAVPLAAPSPVTAARDLAARSGADGLILTGGRTGEPADLELLDSVRAAVPGFPVWIGSGVDPESAGVLRGRCAGVIVGTSLKVGGVVTHPVDPARVAALRRALGD